MPHWTPTEKEFVLVVFDGHVQYAARVTAIREAEQMAMVRPIGEDVEPWPVRFKHLRQHPLSTQRGTGEA